MAIQVQIKGNKQVVSRVLVNLGPELNKQINHANRDFLESVRRGALLMVPRLTRKTAESMIVKQNSKGDWVFSAGKGLQHVLAIEMGYKPHLVSSSAEAYPGVTIAEVYGIPEDVMLLVTGPRRKHFIRDAFQNALRRLPEILDRTTKQSIKNSRSGR